MVRNRQSSDKLICPWSQLVAADFAPSTSLSMDTYTGVAISRPISPRKTLLKSSGETIFVFCGMPAGSTDDNHLSEKSVLSDYGIHPVPACKQALDA